MDTTAQICPSQCKMFCIWMFCIWMYPITSKITTHSDVLLRLLAVSELCGQFHCFLETAQLQWWKCSWFCLQKWWPKQSEQVKGFEFDKRNALRIGLSGGFWTVRLIVVFFQDVGCYADFWLNKPLLIEIMGKGPEDFYLHIQTNLGLQFALWSKMDS